MNANGKHVYMWDRGPAGANTTACDCKYEENHGRTQNDGRLSGCDAM